MPKEDPGKPKPKTEKQSSSGDKAPLSRTESHSSFLLKEVMAHGLKTRREVMLKILGQISKNLNPEKIASDIKAYHNALSILVKTSPFKEKFTESNLLIEKIHEQDPVKVIRFIHSIEKDSPEKQALLALYSNYDRAIRGQAIFHRICRGEQSVKGLFSLDQYTQLYKSAQERNPKNPSHELTKLLIEKLSEGVKQVKTTGTSSFKTLLIHLEKNEELALLAGATTKFSTFLTNCMKEEGLHKFSPYFSGEPPTLDEIDKFMYWFSIEPPSLKKFKSEIEKQK